MRPAIPILRIFDEVKAREFYRDFLGFTVDWEHRFGDGFPLYAQVSNDACVLHLSGHHGDATPGSAVRIETAALADFCAGLRGKRYPGCRPGDPAEVPWGGRELTVTDPFGNKLTFHETKTGA